MAEERFSDEEVSLILRRAVEGDGGDASGLTLAQLKEIAVEVGLDPARVEAAALSVRSERLGPYAQHGGRGVTTRYHLEVAGHLDPERHADLLRTVRRIMGRHGVVTEARGSLEWKARDYFGGRYLTVRSGDGRTHIDALGNFRDGAFVTGSAGGTLGLMGTAVILKATVGGVAGLGALGPLALFAGAALPAYLLYKRAFAQEDRTLRVAVAEVAAQVQVGGELTPSESDRAPGLPSGESSPGGDETPPR